jgi:hypothetical protein
VKRPTEDGPTLWDMLAASVASAVQAFIRPSQPEQPRSKQPAKPEPAKVTPAKPKAIKTRVAAQKQAAPKQATQTQAAPSHRKPRPRANATAQATQIVETKPKAIKASKPARPTMQDRYDALTRELLAEHSIRVRKWRTSMSGVAWELRYRDGTRTRLIEAPKPKSPMSLAIFLHEVGHHVIGLGVYRPRCLEEYHAWRFSLDEMAARGFPITDRVHRRYQRSMHYAVAKATRRGIKSLPDEVQAFTGPMPK